MNEEKFIAHKHSGVVLSKEIKNWKFDDDSVTENISPEIWGSVVYTTVLEKGHIKPMAKIFILRNTTAANLKLIENLVLPQLTNVKVPVPETLKLPSGKKVQVNRTTHETNVAQVSGGISILKKIRTESLFVYNKIQPQLVFWVSYESDMKDDRKSALQFIDGYLRKK